MGLPRRKTGYPLFENYQACKLRDQRVDFPFYFALFFLDFFFIKSFPQSFTSTEGEQSYTMKIQRSSGSSKRELKFDDAIKEFGGTRSDKKKASGYVYDLKAFCFYLKNPDLRDIGWKQIQEYTNVMLELGWGRDRATLVRKYAAFRKFFAYWHLKDKQYLDPNWIPVMHYEKWQPKKIDKENYKKLINVIPTHINDPKYIRNLALINLLWETTATYNEILALNIKDIDLRKRRAFIRTADFENRIINKKVSWSKETNENLRAWLVSRTVLQSKVRVKRDKDALFISCVNKKRWFRLGKSGLSAVLCRACAKAKIDYFNPNSFLKGKDYGSREEILNEDLANILEYAKWGDSINYRVI